MMRTRLAFLALAILFSTSASAQLAKRTIHRLPDTDQLTSYTTTPGEDCDFRFNMPGYVNPGDGTTLDTVTGLMWQRVDGGEMTVQAARYYVDTLSLGGYHDWRLPTPLEAITLLELDKLNPAMDVAYFPDSKAEYWWTSATLFNDTTRIWVTNAGGGIGPHPQKETISAGGAKSYHVRAVRDVGVPTEVMRFTDNDDSTITDNITGLIWQKYPTRDTLTWEQALAYANSCRYAGLSDWRLPNIKELSSINDYTRTAPSLSTTYFPTGVSQRYWSSTTQKSPNPNAWFLDVAAAGITSYAAKTTRYGVILVRGSGMPARVSPVGLGHTDGASMTIQLIDQPVHDLLRITDPSLTANHAEIIGIDGRTLATFGRPDLTHTGLPVTSLPSGIYLLRLQLTDGRTAVVRFSKP